MAAATCTHLNQIHKATPSGTGCKECLEMGATRHPIIRSFEPGEDRRWCYVDEMIV